MLFYLVVFCWSWSFWIVAAFLKISVLAPLGRTLLLLGVLGPMVGGIAFARFTHGGRRWKEYWARLGDPRRIGPKWWPVVLLFVPVLVALAVLLAELSGDTLARPMAGFMVANSFASPSTAMAFLFGLLVLGPVPEELGWRGYALDRLQERRGPLASALILGALWAIWHLPLFFMRDMLHWSHGVGSTWFWLFLVQVPCMSVVMTWLFNNTNRSTLGAILFHFSANLAFALGNVTEATNWYASLLWLAAGLVVAFRFGRSPGHGQPPPGGHRLRG